MSALTEWPAFSRRLLVTSGIFGTAFVFVALLVELRRLNHLDFSLTHLLQSRGNVGQDIGLGILSYAGSLEVTLVIALLLTVPLFKGLRLLALGPAVVLLVASGLEYLGKHAITSAPPEPVYHRVPSFLPALTKPIAANSFPSGHMLRATILYGLVLYLAVRWKLFGRDSSRLSPVLVLALALLGYALVYLGFHWFSDVLGGALLGLTVLIAMIAYLERKRSAPPRGRQARAMS